MDCCMSQIKENIISIQNRIEKACLHAGRSPDEVSLLLATKTVSPEGIKEAFRSGCTLIAENRVQELKAKYAHLQEETYTSHFIGHLQSNKIKDILSHGVSCLQSVDRLELAEKIHKKLITENRTLDIYIQVNTSQEESKFGVSPENAIALVREIAKLETLKIKGLMTIGVFSAEAEKVRACFRILKCIQGEIAALNISGVDVSQLSMGMSGDLEIAIEEGSTMIRVGTAVFGERITTDQFYWNESA